MWLDALEIMTDVELGLMGITQGPGAPASHDSFSSKHKLQSPGAGRAAGLFHPTRAQVEPCSCGQNHIREVKSLVQS